MSTYITHDNDIFIIFYANIDLELIENKTQ